MKKFLLAFLAAICALSALAFSGCKKDTDYSQYISEKRTDIYLYSNDGTEIKIYKSEKETPFCADGIKGNVTDITEIFVKLTKNCEEVEISAGGISGEMNFKAVENLYYLSASAADISGDSVEVTLKLDGKEETYTAQSVKYGNIISCENALQCVIERDKELFESMTDNGVFSGEIFIRLLYDEGCFYYVGVCDRNKNINAYLVDGERGKIITTKQLTA